MATNRMTWYYSSAAPPVDVLSFMRRTTTEESSVALGDSSLEKGKFRTTKSKVEGEFKYGRSQGNTESYNASY
jgi:hypothetical protein